LNVMGRWSWIVSR